MRVNKKESKLLKEAIEEWENNALIDKTTAQKLRDTVSPYRSEFDTIAFYAAIAAVSCAILAFGALVLDEKWIERIRKYFAFSEFAIGLAFALCSSLLIWIARRRNRKYPYASLANESFTILIALTLGVSVTYFSKSLSISTDYYGIAIFITAVLYGIVAFYLNTKLLWCCALLALISSWGAQTYAWSQDTYKTYFLGMNYPLRMTFLGAAMVGCSWLLRQQPYFKKYYSFTWHFSWIFLFTSALFLSVSGNLSYEVWSAIRQGKLFMWAIAYTVLLIIVLAYAIRNKEETLRDITIIFFLLNIYTRYFEYFWNRTNKGLFFALLAISFWLISKKAEQLRKKLS